MNRIMKTESEGKVLFNEECSICNFEIKHYKKRSQLEYENCSQKGDKYLKALYVEFPDGYDWGFPGFMSIFVPYGETADFFYSGHVGICMIMFLEFWAVKWYFMAFYSIFTMHAQVFLMIALRSHYTMDMISGVIFAHYLWILSEKYSFIVDQYIFGIPLEKRMASDLGLSPE